MQLRNTLFRYGAAIIIALLCSRPTIAVQSATPADDGAFYRVTFTSTWSQNTHPHPDGAEQFPGNAHFSPLIGATHEITTTFWAAGELASAGIEQMAETGRVASLRSEFAAAGNAVLDILSGAGIDSPGETTTARFRVDRNHPSVTLVTMIAPSPDWFVGVSAFSLLNEQGAWREEVAVTLYPYDAGSDDGADYRSADVEPTIHQPIANLTGVAPFSTEPIGVFTFERVYAQHLPLVVRAEK